MERLPDALLIIILSCVEEKDVLSACCASKRIRDLVFDGNGLGTRLREWQAKARRIVSIFSGSWRDDLFLAACDGGRDLRKHVQLSSFFYPAPADVSKTAAIITDGIRIALLDASFNLIAGLLPPQGFRASSGHRGLGQNPLAPSFPISSLRAYTSLNSIFIKPSWPPDPQKANPPSSPPSSLLLRLLSGSALWLPDTADLKNEDLQSLRGSLGAWRADYRLHQGSRHSHVCGAFWSDGTDNGTLALSSPTGMSTLVCRGAAIPTSQLISISSLGQATNLTYLDLSGCFSPEATASTPLLMRMLRGLLTRMDQLEVLVLSDNNLAGLFDPHPPMLPFKQEVLVAGGLRRGMSEGRPTQQPLQPSALSQAEAPVPPLLRLPSLSELQLAGSSGFGFAELALIMLSTCPALRRLGLERCRDLAAGAADESTYLSLLPPSAVLPCEGQAPPPADDPAFVTQASISGNEKSCPMCTPTLRHPSPKKSCGGSVPSEAGTVPHGDGCYPGVTPASTKMRLKSSQSEVPTSTVASTSQIATCNPGCATSGTDPRLEFDLIGEVDSIVANVAQEYRLCPGCTPTLTDSSLEGISGGAVSIDAATIFQADRCNPGDEPTSVDVSLERCLSEAATSNAAHHSQVRRCDPGCAPSSMERSSRCECSRAMIFDGSGLLQPETCHPGYTSTLTQPSVNCNDCETTVLEVATVSAAEVHFTGCTPTLTHLSLGWGWSGSGLLRLAELSGGILTKLEVDVGASVTDADLVALAPLCPQLRRLRMRMCAISDAGVNAVLKGCPGLLTLALEHCVGPWGSQMVEGLLLDKGRWHLEELVLSGGVNTMSDDELALLIGCRQPRLRRLCLVNCRCVTDRLLGMLACHASCLEDIRLEECKQRFQSTRPMISPSKPRHIIQPEQLGRGNLAQATATPEHRHQLSPPDVRSSIVAGSASRDQSGSNHQLALSEGAVLQLLMQCRRLRQFRMRHACQVGERFVAMVAKHCPLMTAITLDACDMTVNGVSTNPNAHGALQHLVICRCTRRRQRSSSWLADVATASQGIQQDVHLKSEALQASPSMLHGEQKPSSAGFKLEKNEHNVLSSDRDVLITNLFTQHTRVHTWTTDVAEK